MAKASRIHPAAVTPTAVERAVLARLPSVPMVPPNPAHADRPPGFPYDMIPLITYKLAWAYLSREQKAPNEAVEDCAHQILKECTAITYPDGLAGRKPRNQVLMLMLRAQREAVPALEIATAIAAYIDATLPKGINVTAAAQTRYKITTMAYINEAFDFSGDTAVLSSAGKAAIGHWYNPPALRYAAPYAPVVFDLNDPIFAQFMGFYYDKVKNLLKQWPRKIGAAGVEPIQKLIEEGSLPLTIKGRNYAASNSYIIPVHIYEKLANGRLDTFVPAIRAKMRALYRMGSKETEDNFSRYLDPLDWEQAQKLGPVTVLGFSSNPKQKSWASLLVDEAKIGDSQWGLNPLFFAFLSHAGYTRFLVYWSPHNNKFFIRDADTGAELMMLMAMRNK